MPRKIRPIRIDGNIAYIPLTRGYTAIIDAADVPLVDDRNWRSLIRPHTVYAVCNMHDGESARSTLLHRVIMGDPSEYEIDHRDGEGLDCRRQNLRTASDTQNKCNQRIGKRNTSGYKGATWSKRRKRWQSSIMLNGRQKFLGYFDTAVDAHKAYSRASAEVHGEFGRLK